MEQIHFDTRILAVTLHDHRLEVIVHTPFITLHLSDDVSGIKMRFSVLNNTYGLWLCALNRGY